MQRSRKALQARRAVEKVTSGKDYLYKISVSLVFVLWGLVFLFSLWRSRGHGYGDASGGVPVGVSNWSKNEQCKTSNSVDEVLTKQIDACILSETFCSDGAKDDSLNGEPLSNGESGDNGEPGDEENYISPNRKTQGVETSESALKHENDVQKNDLLSQAVPLGLDEFKSRTASTEIKSSTSSSGSVTHRVDQGGEEYNYASESKGAKVLASNKEAKGASNILSRNKDKYLRNPCSSEEKFVIVELSEETLVDTIGIANFEHYSSNLKDFELHGSMAYPTDVWVFLGNFTASNVKQSQRFVLQEPKWVRYLKLNLQSHYGSEFYCTLSIVEVYGVDVVERLLEDLMYKDSAFASREGNGDKRTSESVDVHQNTVRGITSDPSSETSSEHEEIVDRNVPSSVEEIRQQVGRMPGDTVLKILMQRVRNLDVNLPVLEQYVEELNSRYVNIFKLYSKDIGEQDLLIRMMKEDIRSFLHRQEVMMKDISKLDSWKSDFSAQFDHMLRDSAILRDEVEKVREHQVYLEDKGIVVFFVCAIFSFLAILRLCLDMVMSIYRILSFNRKNDSRKFCIDSSSWFLLLLSCSIIIFILTS